VRIVTNRSSGKTAIELTREAFYRGASVELFYGSGKEIPPDFIKVKNFESINDLEKLLKNKNLKIFDIIIVCAALSDYIPKKQNGKIPSGKDKLILEFGKAKKIISELRNKSPNSKIVGFKLEASKDKMMERGFDLLKKNNLDIVVANTLSGFKRNDNEILIINKKGEIFHKRGKKSILANYILDMVK
jgi:phosphopantothenoylcysteine decarboxylase/phosphopantothenate--cysteine ligase